MSCFVCFFDRMHIKNGAAEQSATNRNAATTGVRGGVGVSSLSAGKGHTSRRR